MAAQSNAGFHNEDIDSVLNRRAISFQPGGGAINRLSEMVPMGNYFGLSSSSEMMIYSGVLSSGFYCTNWGFVLI